MSFGFADTSTVDYSRGCRDLVVRMLALCARKDAFHVSLSCDIRIQHDTAPAPHYVRLQAFSSAWNKSSNINYDGTLLTLTLEWRTDAGMTASDQDVSTFMLGLPSAPDCCPGESRKNIDYVLALVSMEEIYYGHFNSIIPCIVVMAGYASLGGDCFWFEWSGWKENAILGKQWLDSVKGTRRMNRIIAVWRKGNSWYGKGPQVTRDRENVEVIAY
ncbi:hypothetical protein DFH29DRAFT_878118 [Suillus ampliporus]|nr:hypothetical protein DFH29DRAFT_878118 [Suillus ampliporus]